MKHGQHWRRQACCIYNWNCSKVNGKVRGRLSINKDQEAESVKQQALELENVKAHADGKEIKKIIYVPNKIVNIVMK